MVRVIFRFFRDPPHIGSHAAEGPQEAKEEAGGHYQAEHYENSFADRPITLLILFRDYDDVVRIINSLRYSQGNEVRQPDRVLDCFAVHDP